MRVLAVLLITGLFTASSSFAQMPPAAGGEMPNAGQMSGIPLPSGEVPDATVVVRVVREQMGNNIANQPVILKGAQKEETVNTDAQGRATFAGFPVGTVVYAESVVDGEPLRSQEFDVPAKGGIRVALVAGAAAAAAREQAAREAGAKEAPREGVVSFGGDSRIIMEFQDDNLSLFYLLDVVNAARTPIDTGEPVIVELPTGAIGAATMEGSSPLGTVSGTRILINGPFPPGITPVQVGFRLPWRGSELELQQQWPVAMDRLFVAIEKIGQLHMESPQFEQHNDAEAGGTPFIMATGPRLNAGDTMTVKVTGLPHYSTMGRDITLAVSLLILVAGTWFAFTGKPARSGQEAQLQQRREKLFSELVDLDQQLKEGRIDQVRYASKRQGIAAQLERVMGELDRSPGGGGEGIAA